MPKPAAPEAAGNWDAGSLRHLLPAVSDTQILIKASFAAPLAGAPVLRVDNRTVTGTMTDTRGEHWQCHATGLKSARRYTLALTGRGAKPLCENWSLLTFPALDARPEKLRVLFSPVPAATKASITCRRQRATAC